MTEESSTVRSWLAFSLYLIGFPFGLLCAGIWKLADLIDGRYAKR